MKFYVYTLGCKVNTYESNIVSELLLSNNYILDENNPKICIVNSCTVTDTAFNKTLKLIRRINKTYEDAIIIVMGCASQIDYDKFISLEGVKIIIGNKNKTRIIEYINEYLKTGKQIVDIYDLKNQEFEPMVLNNFNKTRAFVKIEDGCENFCSYCIIPYARGKVCSKDKVLIMEEVCKLVKSGHKEIVLTGIHTGHYGADLDNYNLSKLLNDLKVIKGIERIRISSIEITELNDEFLDVLKNNKLIVDHLHIPIQSGTDKILKLMNRKYDIKYFKDKINKIREIRPNISITTDLIVGFPTETDTDFSETVSNVLDIQFSKIHVFPFSKRKNTVAYALKEQVDNCIKKNRVKKMIEVSKKLELTYMKKFIYTKVMVLVEESVDGYLYGHTDNYLYVRFKGSDDLIHKEVCVYIEKINYPYLEGTKIEF